MIPPTNTRLVEIKSPIAPPYIMVDATRPGVDVPQEHIKDGQIVLNVASQAVLSLALDNEHIEFKARFSGVLRHIYTPIQAVMAIYAKENGQGMAFNEEPDDGGDGDPPTQAPPSGGPSGKKKGGKPHLRVVK